MKVALVHDYIKEFGGAERVLKALTEMFPKAPIYTAFCVKGSTAEREFKGCEIHENWLAPLLKIGRLYSPLRFLTPIIWRTTDLSHYDLVITSCSWYITRGFKTKPKTYVVVYCHTPPRWLYGYETSINLQKYWPVKAYALVVGHFMRMYDFKTAQAVKYWIANSKNVQARIRKFYRKNSVVIYPPVEVEKIIKATTSLYKPSLKLRQSDIAKNKDNYFLIVSRLVGAKGIENAIKAFQSKELSKYKLKIVGETPGFSNLESEIKNQRRQNIKFLGRVSDKELWGLYARAQGFIALARDEDFGMTVVEAQAAGCPVVAFNGGGFKESVVDGKTGILVDAIDEKTIVNAVKKLNKIEWDKAKLHNNAERFSREKFIKDIRRYISVNIKR